MSGCAEADNKISLVDEKGYASPACWIDQSREVVAYLVFARNEQLAIPYLISVKCVVEGYNSYGEATLHMLNTIRVADDYGTLQRAFPNVTIADNVPSDQPLPSSDSKVYYIRMELAKSPGSHVNVRAPNKIVKLSDTNVTFEIFLGLSKDQREQLLQFQRKPRQ